VRSRKPSSARHLAPEPPQPGERLVRTGALVFGVGTLGILAVLVLFLLGRDDVPLGATLVASLLPVGLGIALVGLLRGARSRR
jgi:hypothetical protein